MNVDLELYRVFCEVVKYKNISKAAENMYVSQSAITQSIKKLETELGGTLFYRNKNGVELTEEGKHIYEYVKDSIETMSNAENIFSKYVNLEKGKIRIGGSNSLVSSLILDPLLNFIKKYPGIDVAISGGLTDVLLQKLSNGELDIVVLNLPYNNKKYLNIETLPLRTTNFCFFASNEYIKEHPIKSIKEIEKHTLIVPKKPSLRRKMLDEYCNKRKLNIEPNYEVASSSIMKKMVLNNIGIGFTNEDNIKDILDEVKVIHKAEITDINEGIAVLNKNMCNKATLEFVKEIKDIYNID